ncbi:MAG: AAA family ATPase [Acidobacteriaceae bacterium]|nr:AAA family ATPase [Acidobacteriaceae bacterium]
MLHINLFGNLHVSVGETPIATVNTNRLQSLLAYLILHSETPQPRDALAFILWPASRESQARTNLRQLVHNLRRALPTDCDSLVTDHFALHWRRDDSCEVDVWQFQSAIENARDARKGNDSAREMLCLTQAAALYIDDLLPALYDDWLPPFRDEYRRTVCTALERLASKLEERNQYATAIPHAERLLVLDPLAEAHHQLLIRLHAGNGDRASALRAYHKCMRILRRELGVEPGTATRQLFEQILKESGGVPVKSAPTVATAANAFPVRENTYAMVGRTEEWNALITAWQKAVERGPRVALISGEPGIGKTKLADEFYSWCSRNGHAVARSRCYAGQGQRSYSPLVELLRSDSVRMGWTKLASRQTVELARVIPEITAHLSGHEPWLSGDITRLPESMQRLRLYESLNAAIGGSAKPLLLFLDDMQWCDTDTFDWLATFLRSHEASRVLLLGTIRSEETEREHPFTAFAAWLRQADMLFEIALEPLNADQTAELAGREAAQPLGSERLSEIFRATRGNPLFVLESVRAGLQSSRVQAVIAARLARLSAAAYELATIASVVGRPFSVELIGKAADWDESSAFEALDELWRRRIVEGAGSAEYDFTHDLLRQAAYSELSPVRRRHLHRRVARALTDVHRTNMQNWNGQIASHFEQGGMAEAAIEWYERAAAHARERYADSEAAGLLRHALGLCASLPQSETTLKQELTLLLGLGPALVTTEGYSAPEVGSTYERALELSRRFEPRDIFASLGGAWLFHTVRGDLERGKQFSLEFLTRAQQEADARMLLAGNFFLGTTLFHLGELRASLHHMNEALHMLGAPNDSVLELFTGTDLDIFCRAYVAHLTWHCGDEEQSIAQAAEAVAVAKRLRHPFGEAIALDYAAMLHVFREDSRAAFDHALEAVEICSRYGFAYYRAMGAVLLGWSKAASGDIQRGLTEIRDALKQLRGLGAELRLPFYLKLLAETLGRAGQAREGLADVSTAFATAAKNGESWALSELYRIQGELLIAEDRMDQAQISFRKGLEAARHSGSVALERKISLLLNRTFAGAS